MKAGAFELASIEYQGVTPLLNQMQMSQRQLQEDQEKKPQPQDLKPYRNAIESHRKLAERFMTKKEHDLAIAEYQLLANLLQFAQSRVQQNLSADIQALSWDENLERRKVDEWYQKEIGVKNLPEKQREAIDKQHGEKLEKLRNKFDPIRDKQVANREQLQKASDEQIQKFRDDRIAIYEKIAAVFKEKGDDQQSKSYTSMVYQERASMYQQNNDNEKAMEQYRAWLKDDPESYAARSGLAQVLIAMGQWDKAEEQYLWQLKKSPDNQGILSQLARVYVEQKKWDAAVQQHRAILDMTARQKTRIPQGDPGADERKKQIDREMAYQYIELGRVLVQASRGDEAKKVFDKAKTLSPDVAPQIPSVP